MWNIYSVKTCPTKSQRAQGKERSELSDLCVLVGKKSVCICVYNPLICGKKKPRSGVIYEEIKSFNLLKSLLDGELKNSVIERAICLRIRSMSDLCWGWWVFLMIPDLSVKNTNLTISCQAHFCWIRVRVNFLKGVLILRCFPASSAWIYDSSYSILSGKHPGFDGASR